MTGREFARFIALTLAHVMIMLFLGGCLIGLIHAIVWLVQVMTLELFIAVVGLVVLITLAMLQAWRDILKARRKT